MRKKGFANIAVIVVIAIVGVAGYFVITQKSFLPKPFSPSSNTPVSSNTDLKLPPPPEPTPPLTPHVNNNTEPTVKTGDIDEIQTLLTENAWVRIIVTLKGNEFTAPEFQDYDKKRAEIQKIQEAALATLTEEDFIVHRKFQLTAQFSGTVSETGMEKLLKSPHVVSIHLDTASPAN